MMVPVSRRRRRADLARSLRVDPGEPHVDENFVAELAATARASADVQQAGPVTRLRLAALAVGLSAQVVGSGVGLADGAGGASAPWSPDPPPPAPTVSPASPPSASSSASSSSAPS